MTPFWWVLLAVVVVLLGVYLSWTAGRLDRLHARVDAAWAALDAALVRRAAAARAVVLHLPPRAPQSAALEQAAATALEGGPVAREAVENDLSSALRAALPLLPAEAGEAALAELSVACARVRLARSFHNSAVADSRVLRVRRLVRLLHLAGHRAMPQHFDMDDGALSALPPPRVPPAPAAHARPVAGDSGSPG